MTDPWPITHRIEWSEGERPAPDALPARPGVLLLRALGGEATFVGAGADVRALARRRLIEPSEQDRPSRRVDHAGVARSGEAIVTSTNLETDGAFLEIARRAAPGLKDAATDRWRGWFVHVNPEATFPRFTKRALPAGDAGPPEAGVLLGPARDKHAAQTLIETLEDAFDLCRYHHLLVQAPHASACAYKEMGRCPAPCDGSETMESYRSRVAEAVAAIDRGAARARARWDEAMRDAGAALDFEGAASWKTMLERTEPLAGAPLRHARRLERFRFLAIGPGGRAGWARLHAIGPGVILRMGDVLGEDDASAARSAEESAGRARRMLDEAPAFDFGRAACERVGLACRHLFASAKAGPRQDVFAPLGGAGETEGEEVIAGVARAIRRMSRPRRERVGEVRGGSDPGLDLPAPGG